MVDGLALRVSWICLLLFSSGSCFPANQGDYQYPYTGGSSGGAAPGSNLQSEGLHSPLVNLQYGPSVNYQQPGSDPLQASSPTGNQSPSSLGAPSVAAGWSVSAPGGAGVPSQGPGNLSPAAQSPPPSGAGKETLFSGHSQSVGGASGNSNMGSGGVASNPGYMASLIPPFSIPFAAGNMAPTLDFGDGPVPYIGAPATSNGYLATSGGQEGHNAATTSSRFGAGPGLTRFRQPAGGADTTFYNPTDGAAPATSSYVNRAASGPGQPWVTQPAGGAGASFSSQPEEAYPYDAAATSNSGSGAASGPGFPWFGQPAGGADSSYNPSNWMSSLDFPDFSVWDSNPSMLQGASETSPLPPSSYIIQSRNAYLRALETLSHTNYSPEYPEPPVFASAAAKAPSKSPPMTSSEGGKKV